MTRIFAVEYTGEDGIPRVWCLGDDTDRGKIVDFHSIFKEYYARVEYKDESGRPIRNALIVSQLQPVQTSDGS